MYWKLALAQHPMYLLIKEDTSCAERTRPWGEPDIESYIARLRQNLATLRQHPEIKIGYEWSGLELEQLAYDAPDVFSEMLNLVKAGQSSFYNGTYAQPHLQTLSSESNYRQFEWGARVYRELCNTQVQVYAHQESSVNEQTPQLLRAFGIRYAALPRFLSALRIREGGELLFHGRFGLMFTHGDEFAEWRGLDGTVTDLYLVEPNHLRVPEWIRFQEILGLSHVPPVMIEMPDLVAVDEQWISGRSGAEFALLDEVLAERRQICPPRFQVGFHTDWSYIEGIRAEELARENWRAEVSALRAEGLTSLAWVLLNTSPESSDPIWQTILTTQHHDAYCFCAPELRDKSIYLLREAEAEAARIADRAAQAIVEHVETPVGIGQPLLVFNTVPHAQRGVVEIKVGDWPPVIADLDGNVLPCEITSLSPTNYSVRFIADCSGLGYATLVLKEGGQDQVEDLVGEPFTFENTFYRAKVQPDGTFTSLAVKPWDQELLGGETRPGNSLAARDSTGLGPRHDGTMDLARPLPKWEPVERGPELQWQCIRETRVRHSPLGATLFIEGKLGSAVMAQLVIHFYHALARIDLNWTFAFEQASIGHFFDDETKLRVQWPLAFSGDIHHDIAFGVVQTRAGRSFLPASWVDISDGQKGFAYFHQGTLKHWVLDQTLVNLFAWGEDTDAIGNRVDMTRWAKCFDQRLHGTHTLHTAVYPHGGDWRTADVPAAARSYRFPPVAYRAGRHSGNLPPAANLLTLSDPEVLATAVQVHDSQILCRLYSIKRTSVPPDVHLDRLRRDGLLSLSGEPIDALRPFQIAHLLLTRDE